VFVLIISFLLCSYQLNLINYLINYLIILAADSFLQPSHVPLKTETHGGEDVAIYACGPMAHLFLGVQEQHYIPHAMAYASCVGRNRAHCNFAKSSASLLSFSWLYAFVIFQTIVTIFKLKM